MDNRDVMELEMKQRQAAMVTELKQTIEARQQTSVQMEPMNQMLQQRQEQQRNLEALPAAGQEAEVPQVLVNQTQVKEGYFDKKERQKRQKQAEQGQYDQFKAMKAPVTEEFLNTNHMQGVLQKETTYKENGQKQKIKQSVLLEKVQDGDYSHLEQLDPVLRQIEAGRYMAAHRAELSGSPAEVVRRLKQQGVQAMLHPLLRIGISMGMKGLLPNPPAPPEGMQSREFFESLDAHMNEEVMVETILKQPTEAERQALHNGGIGDADITRSGESQIFIAKIMLATQMGNLQKKRKIGKDKQKKDIYETTTWEGPIANAYAHCSRVGFVLPKEGDVQGENDTIMGRFMGKKEQVGVFKRGAATHSLRRKSKTAGKEGFKEEKTFGTFSNQWGMNVAVGGLGNQGISGAEGADRMLKNDGSCGHVYMHVEEESEDAYAGMLIGFESDSYKKTNQLGHTHGFGNGEFASSFGGQRMDEIGDKYGGREVDLSGVNATEFKSAMLRLETKIRNLRENPDGQAELERLVRKLCGTQMNRDEINALLYQGTGNR